MPEYQLKIAAQHAPDAMNETEAAEYAPQWGDGGEGYCMYCDVSDVDTCRAILAHIATTLLPIARRADWQDPDDVAQLQRLANYCRALIDAAEQWESLSPMARGFVECLFFQAPEDPDGDDGDIHRDSGVGDLAPDTLRDVAAICQAFERAAGDDIRAAAAIDGYSLEQAGRDLCFDMSGAGVGFCDRDQLKIDGEEFAPIGSAIGQYYVDKRLGARLAHAADKLGHCDGLYRGGDGRIYLAAYGAWQMESAT